MHEEEQKILGRADHLLPHRAGGFLHSADIFQAALIVLAVVIAGLAVWLPRMLESKA